LGFAAENIAVPHENIHVNLPAALADAIQLRVILTSLILNSTHCAICYFPGEAATLN
jgi:hypothetical protein